MNNTGVVVIRLQYHRRPESGEAGFNEDTTSFPLRAAVRIQMAIQPKLSGPIQVARNLIRTALVYLRQKSTGCCAKVFHLSNAPFVYGNHRSREERRSVVRA